jgi:ketosteroid isomerase-like protein
MSQENLHVIREASRAFNERDTEGILRWAHPEIEIRIIGGFEDLIGGSFTGHAGARRYFTDLFATFKTLEVDHQKFIEAGEQVVTITRIKATVEGSATPIELVTSGIVWRFKEGKINEYLAYYDSRQALEAAGLSE